MNFSIKVYTKCLPRVSTDCCSCLSKEEIDDLWPQHSYFFTSDIMRILGCEPAAVIRKQYILVQYQCVFQLILHFTSSVDGKFQMSTAKTDGSLLF